MVEAAPERQPERAREVPERHPHRTRRLTAAHFIQSVVTLGAAQVASWVGSAVLIVMLPRYLGDVGLGKLSFALVLTTLLGLGASLGTEVYVAREIARDESRAPGLIAAALGVRIPLGVLIALVTAVGAHYLADDQVTRRTVYVLCFAIVLGAADLTSGALQGLHRMRALAAVGVVSKLMLAAVVAGLLMTGAGPAVAAVAWLVGSAAGMVVGYTALLRALKPSFRVDWRLSRQVVLGSFPNFLWQAALIVYGQVDTVLLSFLATDAVIGWYGVAYRIVTLPTFWAVIVTTVAFPALSAAARDRVQFSAIARRSVQVVLLVSVPVAVGAMLLPDKLTRFLGYPPSFDNSWIPIILLAPHIPIVGLDMVIGYALNACGRQRAWSITAVSAAVLNPAVNLLAIPYTQAHFGNGAIGAAAVTTLTEVFLMVVGLWLLPRGTLGRSTAIDVLKVLCAALAMTIAVLILRRHSLPALAALGAVVYLAACVTTGAITRDDIDQVLRQLRQRFSRAGPEPAVR